MFGFRAHLDPSGITEDPAQDQAAVRTAYNDGRPFFTRDAFWSVVQAFDRARREGSGGGTEVAIKGVNGVAVNFYLQTGVVVSDCPAPHVPPGSLVVVTEPRLGYRSVEAMSGQVPMPEVLEDLPIANCLPMLVFEDGAIVDKDTGEPIPHPLAKSRESTGEAWEVACATWQKTWDLEKLEKLFHPTQYDIPLPSRVDKVIGFGLGSMALGRDFMRVRHGLQHAILQSIRDLLLQRGAEKVGCFVQDPMYQPLDKEILGNTGITVLNDPRAFLEVDANSVVVAFNPSFPLRQIIADIARPAVLIWASLPEDGRIRSSLTDPTSSRVTSMIVEHYTEAALLPPCEWFGITAVYVRNDSS